MSGGKIRIVTDSSAQFLNPDVIAEYGIIVIPQTITFGSQRFREGIDLDPLGFFKLANSGSAPILTPPTVEQFADVYQNLYRSTDQILSIHISRALSKTLENSQAATHPLLGRCNIQLIDSLTTSVGLALLVEAAAKMAAQTDSIEAVARSIRKQVSSVYTIFYSETFTALQRAGLVSESQAILGAMLGIRPFLTIEDGELVAMEKVRTRAQAIDKLVEFAAEFESTDRTVILHSNGTPNETLRQFQERLQTELGWGRQPMALYGPSLGTFIGTDALGIVVYQAE